MNKKIFFLVYILSCISIFIEAQETIKISGRVTDFNNNPIDSCFIFLSSNFKDLYTTYTDKDGYY